MKKRALIVTTVASFIDQFCMNDISILLDDYDVQVAANFKIGNNTSIERINEFKDELLRMNIKINDLDFDRNPLNRNNIKSFRKLKRILLENKFDLIHCHTPIAAMFTRVAAKKLRLIGTKVIYTAHGFHFYKGAPLVNWLVYYTVEKCLARFTDTLITINKEDYERAKHKLKLKKIEYIPGVGIDLDSFNMVTIDRALKHNELGLPINAFVVLSVGELNKNKNHEVIIRAIEKISNPNIHYIICGQGKLEKYLKNLCNDLGIERQVHLLGFRKDILEIFKISDIFAFPSMREGLSVALMESMANGLPVLCSNIRGNVDLIEEGKGGYLIESKNINDYSLKIIELYSKPEIIKLFGTFNKARISKFSKDIVIGKMKEIYSTISK